MEEARMNTGRWVRETSPTYIITVPDSSLLALEMNVISRAKGSCYIENGTTKIICAVFELREIPRINKYA